MDSWTRSSVQYEHPSPRNTWIQCIVSHFGGVPLAESEFQLFSLSKYSLHFLKIFPLTVPTYIKENQVVWGMV